MSVATEDGATQYTTNDAGVFDAADAFLKRMEKPSKADASLRPKDQTKAKPEPVSEENEEDKEDEVIETEDDDVEPEDDEGLTEEDTEDNDGEDDDDTDDDDDTEDEGKPKPKEKAKDTSDDVTVKVMVDGKEHEVSVGSLKRLYGQEASLTRKSQEVAAKRKEIDEIGAKQVVGLTTMFNRAQERAKPYAEIDFLALAKDPRFTAEELTSLRKEAQKAFDDVKFFGDELEGVYKDAQARRHADLKTQAVEAHKVLNDPKNGIPGWSQSLYNDIRQFAISNGLNADVVNELTDPHAMKLIHKAMLYEKGQKALKKTTKVVKTPKRIVKSSSVDAAAKAKPSKSKQASDNLRRTGSIDSATDVFLSRMLG